ncbi:MAG: hypothetical protein QOG89_3792, partial [Thermomicrobiales bacterium]|nr:hypothetical protein [Thermomicrobiales bacterium]
MDREAILDETAIWRQRFRIPKVIWTTLAEERPE